MSKLISSQVIKIASVSSLRAPMHKYLKIVAPHCVNGIYKYFDSILIAIDKNQIGRAKEICERDLELTLQETDLFICYSIMIAKDTIINARKLWIEQYQEELKYTLKKQQEKEILSLQLQQQSLSRAYMNKDSDLDFDLVQEEILQIHAKELEKIAGVAA